MTPQSTQTDESRAVIAFRVIVGVMVITAMLAGTAVFTATETASAQNGTSDIFYTTNQTHLIEVDAETMTEIDSTPIRSDDEVSVSHSESYVVVASNGVQVFDRDLNEVASTSNTDDYQAVEIHTDGYVYAANDATDELEKYDPETLTQQGGAPIDAFARNIAFEGDYAYASNGQGVAKVDLTDMTVDDTASAHNTVTSVTYTSGFVFAGIVDRPAWVYKYDAGTMAEISTASSSEPDTNSPQLAASQTHVYAQTTVNANQLIEFSTDLNEDRVNTSIDYPTSRMEFSGDELYIAPGTASSDAVSGVYVIDVSGTVMVEDRSFANGGYGISVTETPDVTYPVDVTVQYQNGTAIADADVTINESGSTVASGQTDTSGVFSTSLPDGDYTAEATKTNHTVDTASFSVAGAGESITLTLEEIGEETELNLHLDRWMPHNSSQPFVVTFTNETGQRSNVTTQADVTSDNASVVTVDAANYELDATGNESIAARANITANYTSNGVEYSATDYVAVANVSTSNLKVLPPAQRLQGTITDDTIYVIIIAAMLSVAATRFSSAFGGLSMGTMTMVVGYLGGYVGEGIAMLSLFTALFIGLNLAANIDYTVRR